MPAGATCAGALRAIAHDCLSGVELHRNATCRGDANALHEMRIALTRLRTALLFFAPAIGAPTTERLRREASWLNGKLGAARDLDVSLHRERSSHARTGRVRRWKTERQRRYVQVQRTLRTKRYRQFIRMLRTWIGDPNANGAGTQTANRFSTDRLNQWQGKLLRRARRLDRLGTRKRHKLRIRIKRFRYALEWSLTLTSPKQARRRKAMIAHAKTIQESLGKLNDASQHRVLAKTRHLKPLPGMNKLETPKAQQRLLKSAKKAFRELGRTQLT